MSFVLWLILAALFIVNYYYIDQVNTMIADIRVIKEHVVKKV